MEMVRVLAVIADAKSHLVHLDIAALVSKATTIGRRDSGQTINAPNYFNAGQELGKTQ